MNKQGRAIILALQFWTRLPTPSIDNVSREEWQQGARYAVAVGLLIGGLLCVLAWLCQQWWDDWTGALLLLLLWLWLTGGLHLDGVADLADARGAAHGDATRFAAVLKDPHVGSFGVIALITIISAKVILLMLWLQHGLSLWGLLLIPAWARWGSMLWASYTPPLFAGSGTHFAAALSAKLMIATTALLLALNLVLFPFACLFILPICAWWYYLNHHIGGMNGDCLGAGIEWCETAMLLLGVLCNLTFRLHSCP
jgi:adenosylcobinamide-GDP ribazoletransferase